MNNITRQAAEEDDQRVVDLVRETIDKAAVLAAVLAAVVEAEAVVMVAVGVLEEVDMVASITVMVMVETMVAAPKLTGGATKPSTAKMTQPNKLIWKPHVTLARLYLV